MPPRIVFWPHTTRASVASYRIRCAQIRGALAGQGVETGLWRERPGFVAWLLPERPAPDLLVLSKRTSPAALAQALDLRRHHGTRLVLDLCDNIFFASDDPARRARSARLAEMLSGLDAIVTPSDYLRDVVAAQVRPDMRFEVIPDAVEAEPAPGLAVRLIEAAAFARLAAFRADLAGSGIAEGRRLIWFGISGTRKANNGLSDLEAFAERLEKHNAEAPISLTVVSDSRRRFEETLGSSPIQTRYLEWNYWTFGACLASHDIAILPVRPNAYNLAKSANRLTTAFAHGVAVCASGIPSYAPFRECAVLDDWDEGLAGLMRSPQARARRIVAARRIIEADYTLASATRKWRGLFAELLETPRES